MAQDDEFGPEADISGASGSSQDDVSTIETIGLFGGRDSDAEQYHISRSSKMARMWQILKITSRYDVWHGLTPTALRQLLEELGPTFVKAGQILSMRSEILPESFCQELKKLRTQVEPMDRNTMLQALRDEYSTPIEDIFDAIDDIPLGSASIAQVHKARLVTGELVAIKIQRPHVREIMAQDISIMRSLAKRAGRMMPGEQFVDLTSVVDELWQSFREETDFLVEARNLEEFRHNNAGCVYVDCPKPYRRLCTRHVVVMDYIDGLSIDDTVALKRRGYDLEEIGTKLVDNYTQQMLDDGFFHADPHPGNLKIRDGKIIYLDLGLMGRLSAHDRSALQDMIVAVGERNSEKLKDGLLRFSISDAADVDDAGLLRDLDQIIADYGEADLAELNIGDFFNALVAMARKNGIELPGTVTMLARSLVTLEGVVDEFLPGVSIVDIIRHHVLSTLGAEDVLKQEGKAYLREMHAASHSLLKATAQLSGAMKMLTRGQLRVQMELPDKDDLLHNVSRAADRLTMSIVIAGLFIGSSVVYYARIQPVIFGIPVIGFLGYLIALGLGLWIVGSIIREDRQHKRRRR